MRLELTPSGYVLQATEPEENEFILRLVETLHENSDNDRLMMVGHMIQSDPFSLTLHKINRETSEQKRDDDYAGLYSSPVATD